MIAYLAIILLASVTAYRKHDKVPVFVNTVGPFHNPTETYPYYSLPFCRPERVRTVNDDLGGNLAGENQQSSLFDIPFRDENKWQTLCDKTLSQNDIKKFISAIKNHYVFEMFIDDLLVKGFVGEAEEEEEKYGEHVHKEQKFYLFTHLEFSIAYNGPHVIAVNLTTDPRLRLELKYGEDIDVTFSYSTTWVPTHVAWIDRDTLHSKSLVSNQPVEIRWLSIINSFVLVLLLSAFTYVVLMRVLKRDFANLVEIEDDADEKEETGWKLIHGHVFRFPPYPMVFSALVGTGSQMFVLASSILLLSLIGTFYPYNRGARYTAAVLLYAITAAVAGYISVELYTSFGGKKWASCAVLTALTFVGPALVIFSTLNSIAWYYGSSQYVTLRSIVLMTLLWALVTFPLTIMGAVRAKAQTQPFQAPCRTKEVARDIPSVAWYRQPVLHYIAAGFLPFSAVYIEIHYILVSVYGHRVYTLFGILAIAFVMLIIVTGFVTVTLVYFLLTSEDYRWWWHSFFCGSSAGVFMYGYSVFYYKYRSQMNGFLQTTFYFGYLLLLSYAFALMLGALSYHIAVRFVRHIYATLKHD